MSNLPLPEEPAMPRWKGHPSTARACTEKYMRPSFIERAAFRAWMSTGALNKLLRIDGITAGGYIQRCERSGRPIRSTLHDGSRKWRPIDLVARARADGVSVEADVMLDAARDQRGALLHGSAVSEETLKRRHETDATIASSVLTGARMLTQLEIVQSSRSVRRVSGVYFLVDGGEVVYVGQSTNVFSRIGAHLQAKQFSNFAWIPCEESTLDTMESLYIHALQPRLNRLWQGSRSICAPVSFERLIRAATPDPAPPSVRYRRSRAG